VKGEIIHIYRDTVLSKAKKCKSLLALFLAVNLDRVKKPVPYVTPAGEIFRVRKRKNQKNGFKQIFKKSA
jgi:hypothetical protein